MSVISDIEEVIQARCQLITVGNGYSADVAQVVLKKRYPDYQPLPRTITVVAETEQRDPDSDCEGNPPAIAYLLPVRVSCIPIPSRDDRNHWTENATDFANEAKKAIASVTDWHQFGGNSINADFGPIELIEPDGEGPGAAQFVIEILYRVSETDPDTVRA